MLDGDFRLDEQRAAPARRVSAPADSKPGNSQAALIAQLVSLIEETARPDTAAIEACVRGVIADAQLINSDEAKQIFHAALKAAIDTIPPRQIDVTANGQVIGSVKGQQHETFGDVVRFLAAGVPTMLVGPAGSGKSTIAEHAAQALGLRYLPSGPVNSEYKLLGFVDAKGRPVVTLFEDAYRNGGLFLLDEVDASDPQALVAINNAIANSHCQFASGVAEKHADFRLIATANTFGRGASREYVGRNQLDAATLDRFAVVAVDYDESLERALAGDDDWTRWVQKVRAAVSTQGVRHVVSPRASIQGARMLAAGMDRKRVAESLVWRGMDETQRLRIEGAI